MKRYLLSRPLLIVVLFSAVLSVQQSKAASVEGPYPARIAAWDDATKEAQRLAGKQLLADLAQAKLENRPLFSIPKGDYRFEVRETSTAHRPDYIFLREIHDMVIDGHGSTFWFDDYATALAISKCDHLVIKNLYLDWDPLPFTQGRVVDVQPDQDTFHFKIDPGYEQVIPDFRIMKPSFRGVLFDRDTLNFKADQIGFSIVPFWKNRNADGTYTVKLRGFYGATSRDIGITAGDPIAIFPRKKRAIRIENSGQVTLENVTLYAAPFVAFVEAAGTGPNTYRRCRLIRRPGTNRLIAGNADGFNSSSQVHGPVIENCEIDSIGDDFINVHGVYKRVLKQDSPTSLVVQNLGGVLAEPVSSLSIAIYDAESYVELARVQAQAEILRHYTIEPNPLVENHEKKWAGAENIKIGKTVMAHRLSLHKPFILEKPAIIACETHVGQGAVIRGNVFKNSLARGIRLQSTDAVIEKNIISFCAGWGLTFTGQPGFWGESTHSRNVIVRNNTFSDTCLFKTSNPAALLAQAPNFPASKKHPFKNIQIISNTIVRPGGNGIVIRGAETLAIQDNIIKEYANQTARSQGPDSNPIARDVGYGIVSENNLNVKLENNTFSEPSRYAVSPVLSE